MQPLHQSTTSNHRGLSKTATIAIGVAVGAFAILALGSFCFIQHRRAKHGAITGNSSGNPLVPGLSSGGRSEKTELSVSKQSLKVSRRNSIKTPKLSIKPNNRVASGSIQGSHFRDRQEANDIKHNHGPTPLTNEQPIKISRRTPVNPVEVTSTEDTYDDQDDFFPIQGGSLQDTDTIGHKCIPIHNADKQLAKVITKNRAIRREINTIIHNADEESSPIKEDIRCQQNVSLRTDIQEPEPIYPTHHIVDVAELDYFPIAEVVEDDQDDDEHNHKPSNQINEHASSIPPTVVPEYELKHIDSNTYQAETPSFRIRRKAVPGR